MDVTRAANENYKLCWCKTVLSLAAGRLSVARSSFELSVKLLRPDSLVLPATAVEALFLRNLNRRKGVPAPGCHGSEQGAVPRPLGIHRQRSAGAPSSAPWRIWRSLAVSSPASARCCQVRSRCLICSSLTPLSAPRAWPRFLRLAIRAGKGLRWPNALWSTTTCQAAAIVQGRRWWDADALRHPKGLSRLAD